MTGKKRTWFVAWLAMAVLLASAATSGPVLRLFFPIRFAPLIAAEAREHGLDPYLVAALIRVESAFDPQARSAKGATGLMQLMPETAAWIAQQRGLPPPWPAELFAPAVNVDYGCWYLRKLLDDFQGDAVLALAAYNSGHSTVRGWLAERTWSGRPEEVNQIPFPETRAYVRRVLATWQWYSRLYPHFPARQD